MLDSKTANSCLSSFSTAKRVFKFSNAQEVLDLIIEEYQETGKPLPDPQTL
jgi:hypothetical protein